MNHPLYIKTINLTHVTPCLAEPGKVIVTGKPYDPAKAALANG